MPALATLGSSTAHGIHGRRCSMLSLTAFPGATAHRALGDLHRAAPSRETSAASLAEFTVEAA